MKQVVQRLIASAMTASMLLSSEAAMAVCAYAQNDESAGSAQNITADNLKTAENEAETATQPTAAETEEMTAVDPVAVAEVEAVTTAPASETTPTLTSNLIEGVWGDNITYVLDTESGTLTVSGSGAMEESTNYYSQMPFYNYRDKIKTAVFEEGITSICNYVLYGCTLLTSVTLPSTLEEIQYSAFDSCSGLEEIVIPDSVTRIGYSAFDYCEALKKITLPSALKEIEKNTFYKCEALTTVNLPDELEIIGEYAFYDCKNLELSIDCANLKEIGPHAFYNCELLTSVNLTSAFETMGNSAFENCIALKTLTFSDTITEIPSKAFLGCKALESVTIPANVISIGDHAFSKCINMQKAVIEEGVTSVGDYAFSGCTNLSEVQIPTSVTKIGQGVFEGTAYAEDFSDDFVILDNGTLYQYNGADEDVVIPDNVTSIAADAFSGSSVVSVTLPEGVNEISGAFSNCLTLKSVTLPSDMTVLSEEAFSGCTSLETVVFPDALQEIGNNAFNECTSIKNVTLPDSVTRLGENAFYGCEQLSDVVIPENLSWIGMDAFGKTPFLTNQSEELIIFGKVLYYCNSSAEEITVPDGIISITDEAFIFCMDLKNVNLPSSLQSIGSNAFLGCHSMKHIIVPESVTEIGSKAIGFYVNNGTSGSYRKQIALKIYGEADSAIQEYAVENELAFHILPSEKNDCGEAASWSLDIENGVLTISGSGDMTDFVSPSSYEDKPDASPFYKYSSFIRSVVVEEGITSIGEYAFYKCKNIEEIKLPSTLTAIDSYAFYECSSLKNIELPDGLTIIDYYAFGYCGLTSVDIPDGVTEIPDYCFSDCVALESISIPASVSTISSYAFNKAEQLETVEISSGNEDYCVVDGVVYSKSSNGSLSNLIYYPHARKNAVFTVPEGVTTLNSISSPYLKTAVLPASIKKMSDSTFKNCNNLKRVIFLGNAPAPTSYWSSNDYVTLSFNSTVMVSCSFTAENWKESMEVSKDNKNIIWDNLDDVVAQNTLKLTSESTELEVGDGGIIRTVINPMLATEFVWSSSNDKIVSVSMDGEITAISAGTAEISCKSVDGNYAASLEITVKEKPEADTGTPTFETVTLDKELVGSPFTSMQFPCEELQGIYFLNDSNLNFYSLVTHSYETVYSFSGLNGAYCADDMIYAVSNTSVMIYDMKKKSLYKTMPVPVGFSATAVGADGQGRIYISAYETENSVNNRIFLYSPEGSLISETAFPTQVYCFDGFDNSNGRFYVESYYDFYSWGYSHPGRGLNVGVVDENGKISAQRVTSSLLEQGLISRSFDCLAYLCQDVYYEHQNGAALFGDRYLTYVSSMANNVVIGDSDAEGFDSFMSLIREVDEYELSSTYEDITAVGTRVVYIPDHDSLVIYENGKVLNEYDPKTKALISSMPTSDYVYSLINWNDGIFAIERSESGEYSLEYFDWADPEEITITSETQTMKTGDTQQLSLKNGKDRETYYTWTSSDDSILTVTDNGIATAWGEGTVKVSCDAGKLHAEIEIQVLPSGIPKAKTVTFGSGVITNNRSRNNYSTYDSPMKSHLMESGEQEVTRVEFLNEEDGVLIETYDTDGYVLKDTRYVEAELPIFGGFYSGSEYNFLVFGKTNPEESDASEVVRIVRYTKTWERVDCCSVYGANTTIPFDAGNLRMDERNGKLYVYTCHEMYTTDDGLNHQANLIFVIDIDKMTCEQSYYDVYNQTNGYVSHSFSQFIKTDDEFIYRVDHGDGGPRGISLTKAPIDGAITDISAAINAYKFDGGSGENTTGASIGGFELAKDNLLIAFNSVDMTGSNYYLRGKRNIYLYVAEKERLLSNLIPITDYDDESTVTVSTPQLVKVHEDAFMLMWEEKDSETGKVVTKLVSLNGDGQLTSDIKAVGIGLSDCQPIVTSDGLIRWYVTNGKKLYFYTINPFELETIQGNDIQWNYDEAGKTLTISGSGDMADYEYTSDLPWASVLKSVEKVVVEEGVTSVGVNAFAGAQALKSVTLPETVTSIGETAFADCLRLSKIIIPESVTEIQTHAIGFVTFNGSGETSMIGLASFKIIGFADSAAETYAEANNITFSTNFPQKGDVDDDGEITLKDVVLIRKYLVGDWDAVINEDSANVDGDNEITLKDVVMIRRYIAGGWDVEFK